MPLGVGGATILLALILRLMELVKNFNEILTSGSDL
jgi:hypothetical protein